MTEEINLSSAFEGMFANKEMADAMAKQLASQKWLIENNHSAKKLRDLFVLNGYCMDCGNKTCICE